MPFTQTKKLKDELAKAHRPVLSVCRTPIVSTGLHRAGAKSTTWTSLQQIASAPLCRAPARRFVSNDHRIYCWFGSSLNPNGSRLNSSKKSLLQKPRVHSHEQQQQQQYPRQPSASLVADVGDGRVRVVRVQRPVGAEDVDKVKSTLKQILRDWSALGATERAACYGPVLAAIEHHFPRDSWCLRPPFFCSILFRSSLRL